MKSRMPDPATYNQTFYRILQIHSLEHYGTKTLEECHLDDLLKYDYILQNKKVEVKLRHYANNMTNRGLFYTSDILVEKQQHSPREDGWFYECEADRIFYLKLLYNDKCPIENNRITTTRSDLKAAVLYDINWSELKELCKRNNYQTVISDKTTGSLNWIVPIDHIKDKIVWHCIRRHS